MKKEAEDFLESPVFKTLCIQCRGMGSTHGWGTKIPHATRCCKRGEREKREREREKQQLERAKAQCEYS